MLKAAIVGIGSMGRGHLNNYLKFMKEGRDIKLVAICDIDPKKFENYKAEFNLGDMADGNFDFSQFHCYTDVDEMLEKETDLDLVSVVVPTYLHCEISCKCLEHGINVFCEKPMAIGLEQCRKMIDTAEKAGKRLMIGQCLRFWGEYKVLKEIVETGKYGKLVSAYFFRGGSTPIWSYNNWYLHKELGGGAIYDQHIHDVDMVNHLFGLPKKVSSMGRHVYEGCNYDCVSTNYIFDDDKVVNSQNDWCEATGFHALFRANFDKATLICENGKLLLAETPDIENRKRDHAQSEYKEIDFDKNSAYENEILYFADCIRENKPVEFNTPYDSMNTIRLALAEIESCDRHGEPVEV